MFMPARLTTAVQGVNMVFVVIVCLLSQRQFTVQRYCFFCKYASTHTFFAK